ncbi:MAG: RNA pseudouridine synthase, partial [Bacteroidota bacterium]|nr:RNA pseudouridine synthase [Bacteroidota bacterium]
MPEKESLFKVLFEDNHLIAVNKNAGVLVQGDETGDVPLADLVKDYIKQKYNKPGEAFIGVIHRLDRPVSGLVLFAKTSKALERMNALFQEKDISKTYLAIVIQKPKNDTDTLIHWLVKNKQKKYAMPYNQEVKNSQRAELSFKYLTKTEEGYLLEVKPVTGRFHQ